MSEEPLSPATIDYRNPKEQVRAGPSTKRVLAWTFGLGFTLVFLIALLLPSLGRARETAQRVKCASNLKQIGMGVFLYANENRGQLPPDWPTLLMTEDLVPEVFTCPSSEIDRAKGPTTQAMIAELLSGDHLSYYWLGHGLRSSELTPTLVLAFEYEFHVPRDNAKTTGMNVLLGDGSVQFVDEPTAKAIRARHLAGITPIYLPATTTATTTNPS